MGRDVMKGNLKLNTTHFWSYVICMLSDYMPVTDSETYSVRLLSHFMDYFVPKVAFW